jgi:small-conductance mechanosensitive channel
LLRLRYWLEEPYRLQTVRSEVHERIEAALADADVEFAYPHSHLVFDETSGRLEVSVDGESRSSPEGGADRGLDEFGAADGPD